MVERDGFPIACSVACLAFLSIRPFVFVVFLVTGKTIRRCVFEGRREMAFLAFHYFVFAHQGEARLVVVER